MRVTEKVRGFFRRKPVTEDELRAREEARRANDERRFRKLSQAKGGWRGARLPDAQSEIDHWSE
jgi:hypothetical protein